MYKEHISLWRWRPGGKDFINGAIVVALGDAAADRIDRRLLIIKSNFYSWNSKLSIKSRGREEHILCVGKSFRHP